jgi:signal transduction histidine kinase
LPDIPTNPDQPFFKKYAWCAVFTLAGGCAVATVAYNVMGRMVGFGNLPLMSLLPGFCIGSISGFVISFLVIRNRNQLLERLAAEQRVAVDLKAEIDRRIRVEAELRAAKEEADLANRSKSEFLANVSHELRTPLNAIIGFSDTMGNEALGPVGNPRYREYLQDISQAGNHLLNLINDILDLSKIEVGKEELREDIVRISYVVDACTRLVKQRAEEKGVALRVDLSPQPERLFVDGQKLKQILINLLSNSVKFTEAGGRVTLSCRQDRDGYLFAVADTGIGIAEKDIPTAMTAFRQVDGALSRKYGGTGLGLPLSRSLTELHGGVFELRSKIGVGTTVSVRLPSDRIVPEALTAGFAKLA